MLLDIVIIVLRETLEASILVAVLMSIGKRFGVSFSWLLLAFLLGGVGAFIYGVNMGRISDWFDYAGQELVNAGMQCLIYLFVAILIPQQLPKIHSDKKVLYALLVVVVSLALVREGAEILVFYSGILPSSSAMFPALTSGFIGLCIGMSVGAIVYYSLLLSHNEKAYVIHAAMLSLVAAGMILQATQLLIQVDWLATGSPVWDTSAFIAEESVVGQLAYAIFGYESTPSRIELVTYGFAIVILFGVTFFFNRFTSPRIHPKRVHNE